MTSPADIPPKAAALAIEAGVVTTSSLEAANAPSARSTRRRMLETPYFRAELREAGWHRRDVKAWLRTGETPEAAS